MSKFCSLKSHYQCYYIHQGLASSCCKAQLEAIPDDLSKLHSNWNNESEELKKGIQVKSCNSCWTDESLGKKSFRQELSMVTTIDIIEIWLDNLCNQLCSYCSPAFSSEWEKAIPEFNSNILSKPRIIPITSNSTNANIQRDIETIKSFINSKKKNSVELRLLGGEPLMQIKSLEFIQAINSDQITELKIFTNLNPISNKFLKTVLNEFDKSKLAFNISLDTDPEYNHIPRGLFDKTRFMENLELLNKHSVRYSINSVVSILNIFYIDKLLDWCKNNNVGVKFNRLSNRDFLLIDNLLREYKIALLDRYKNLFLPKFITQSLFSNNEPNEEILTDQKRFLNLYFKKANITNVNDALFERYLKQLNV